MKNLKRVKSVNRKVNNQIIDNKLYVRKTDYKRDDTETLLRKFNNKRNQKIYATDNFKTHRVLTDRFNKLSAKNNLTAKEKAKLKNLTSMINKKSMNAIQMRA